ncbi:MAG TPA: type II secretion system protein GspN, partial [Myxococcota bacterium]|nr:type II secretion system protein GspN [Myxococcota bacterium]
NVAMRMGPITRGSPKISIKDVFLWRLSGMELRDLKIMWPATQKEAPIQIDIDKLKSRISIFPLFVGRKSITTNADFYNGTLSSDISLTKQSSLSNIDASLKKLDLAKMAFLETMIGAPLKGLMTMMVDLNARTDMSKDGSGSLSLNIDKGGFGPGTLSLPEGGLVTSFSVPQVNLGLINAKFTLDKGQLESKAFTLSGGDLEGDMQLSLSLGRVPQLSRLNGKGWFSLKKEFINQNETIKMLFDLLPELRAASQSDGKVGFSLRGTLMRPQFRLENYVAAKAAPAPKADATH